MLHGSLVRRLPVGTLHTDKRVTALRSDELDRAVLSFADGEEVMPDLVVFADGRRSFGRKVLDPHRPLRYAGYVAHRGQVGYGPDDDVLDYVRLVSDGMQFGAFPVLLPDGKIGLDWEFNLNLPSERFAEQFGRNPTVRTFVLPHQISEAARREVDSAADGLLPARMAEMVQRTTTRMAAPIVDIAPPERMFANIGRSPAIMIGDALAPVHPVTARGLNNGIDQAAGLALALTQHQKYGANLDAALAGWQARHLPQVIANVQQGPELARMVGLGL
jgi:2,6-dihydroxypyridine 3-monooxygenase